MTTQDFNKAFEIEFSEYSLNERRFENPNNGDYLTCRKSGDGYLVHLEIIDIIDEDFTADEARVLRLIDEYDLELQDYNDDQQLEIDLSNLPSVEHIEESTYTCKNGYVMKTFLLDFSELDGFDKSREYDLDLMIKSLKGWYDYRKKNIVLRSKADAQKVLDFIYA